MGLMRIDFGNSGTNTTRQKVRGMMIDVFKALIVSQFEASLCTLGHAVAYCPTTMWNERIARFPFCQVAFHTLFFTDYYLGPNAESFQRQPFHLANPTLFGDYEQLQDREPVELYDKLQIRTYLNVCRSKVAEVLAAETEESLSGRADFIRRNFSRAELHVYNIRHIQHHAAQLILRLRLNTDVDTPWIGAGWCEPAPTSATGGG